MLHRVLIFGHDSLLLKTREMLLLRAGFDVCLSSDDRIHEILATHPFDLLILCHSIGPQERSEILATASTLHTKLPVLVLTNDKPILSIPDDISVFRAIDGPYDFLRTVCRLTHDVVPPPSGVNSPNPGKKLCHDLQVP